jgi:hypothetical protein
MFDWLKRNKKSKSQIEKAKDVKLRSKKYDPKVLLVLAEAINGNKEAMKLLTKSGNQELNVLVFALYLKNDARDWLMKEGFPHLMAFVNAVEGDGKAVEWLAINGFTTLSYAALAGDGKQEGYLWLKRKGKNEWLLLCRRIQDLKDNIEERHNDLHSFSE